MTHIASPKRVVFGSDSVEISYISTGKMIAKGVANHASKAYEFSHFMPYLDPMHSQLPFERGGKFILPKPFAYDNVSDSKFEAEDQVELVYGIEDEVQLDPEADPVPTPTPRPKWAQKVIEAARNVSGESYDMRKITISKRNP